MEHLLFTYGTLMKDRSGHTKFGELKYVCDATFDDYGIYDNGYYPCAVKVEGFKIKGEVYKVNDAQLELLDQYEDEGNLYIRKEVLVYTEDNKEMKAWFYEYNCDIKDLLLRCPKDEKWNLKKDPISNYAWYMCYGSNILRERFDYYLKKTKGIVYAEKKIIVNGELYCANNSSKWNNQGVAFIDLNNKESKIYGYGYLVDLEQIDKISKEEGSWYPKEYIKKDEYGIDIYTVNGKYIQNKTIPSQDYVEVIAAGLKDRFNLNNEEILDYLKLEKDIKLNFDKKHLKQILEKHC